MPEKREESKRNLQELRRESLSMFREFNISEWIQKSAVLSTREAASVKFSLENGIQDPLVKLVMLPFPQFITEYIKGWEKAKKYLEDPALGYKLYLLNTEQLVFFAMNIKGKLDYVADSKIQSQYNKKMRSIHTTLQVPLGKYLVTAHTLNLIYLKKMVHLSQYIDREEAIRLGLSKAEIFTADWLRTGIDRGYALEEKMMCLNPAARAAFIRLFGLHGYDYLSVKDIAEDLDVPCSSLESITEIFLNTALLTLGEFKNAIGLIDKEYEVEEYRRYSNKKALKKTDLKLSVAFTVSQLGGIEKVILQSLDNRSLMAYIANKYFFGNSHETMEYLLMDLIEVKNATEMFQKKMKEVSK